MSLVKQTTNQNISTRISTLAHKVMSKTRLTSSVALLCLGAINSGCNFDLPQHQFSDNTQGVSISFARDSLTGRYLTDSRVTFSVFDTEERDAQFSITSSDESLLKPSQEPTSDLSEFSQAFEVIAPGEVTLTFRDGDEIIMRRAVQLIEADQLDFTIPTMSSLAVQDLEPAELRAGRGEKIILHNSHQIKLTSSVIEGMSQRSIGIGELAREPIAEGANIYSEPSSDSGVNLHISPNQLGRLEVDVELGGQSEQLTFEVVSSDEIASLTVQHGREGTLNANDDQGAPERPRGVAVAQTQDAEGAPIFGASVTWTRLDHDGETELDTLYGDMLVFDHSETETVTFRVRAGDQVSLIDLPMSSNSFELYTQDAFSGCDARGGLIDQAPLSLLFLVIFALRLARRRQRHA